MLESKIYFAYPFFPLCVLSQVFNNVLFNSYVGQCRPWVSAFLGSKRHQMYFPSILQSTGPKHREGYLCLPLPQKTMGIK